MVLQSPVSLGLMPYGVVASVSPCSVAEFRDPDPHKRITFEDMAGIDTKSTYIVI